MDKIEVPAQATVPYDAIAAGVVGLRISVVNVFAVAGESGWTLIDAGLNGSAGRLKSWAAEHFGDTAPTAIVLTHAHFDHVGAIDAWNVPVYAHVEELPYVTGERLYPPPDPTVGGGLMARMASAYPRDLVDLGDRARPLERGRVGPGHAGMALDPYPWTHRRPRLAVSRCRPRADGRRRVLHHEAGISSRRRDAASRAARPAGRTARPIGMRRANRSVGSRRSSQRSSRRAMGSRWPAPKRRGRFTSSPTASTKWHVPTTDATSSIPGGREPVIWNLEFRIWNAQ